MLMFSGARGTPSFLAYRLMAGISLSDSGVKAIISAFSETMIFSLVSSRK